VISTKETRKWTLETGEKKRLLEAPLGGLKNQGILIIEGSRTSDI